MNAVRRGLAFGVVILTIALLSEAPGQQIQPTQISSAAFVPYSGATNDLDLGQHKLKAAALEIGTPGSPTRIDVTQGTCPGAATAPYDWTLCMEAGILYQVSTAGQKVRVGGVASPPTIQLLTITSPPPATISVTGLPLAGFPVEVFRNGQLLFPGIGYVRTGNIITPAVPHLPAVGDQWILRYQE